MLGQLSTDTIRRGACTRKPSTSFTREAVDALRRADEVGQGAGRGLQGAGAGVGDRVGEFGAIEMSWNLADQLDVINPSFRALSRRVSGSSRSAPWRMQHGASRTGRWANTRSPMGAAGRDGHRARRRRLDQHCDLVQRVRPGVSTAIVGTSSAGNLRDVVEARRGPSSVARRRGRAVGGGLRPAPGPVAPAGLDVEPPHLARLAIALRTIAIYRLNVEDSLRTMRE